MRQVGKLQPNCLDSVWPGVTGLLQKKGRKVLEVFSLKELYSLVANRSYDLWLVMEDEEIEMLGICAWDRHDEKSFYHLLWVVGEDLSIFKDVLPLFEQYACMGGASEIIFSGRKGWGRIAEPLGFVPRPQWVKPVRVLWR